MDSPWKTYEYSSINFKTIKTMKKMILITKYVPEMQ